LKIFKSSLLVFILSSCVSTNNLLNSEQIYVGMRMSTFCDEVLMTYLSDDPCRGNKKYFSSKKAMILYSDSPRVFFVFSSVSNQDIDIFNYSYGYLDLIAYSYEEANFYVKNIL
tara:strand:- start:73 stop:414 length:342 start_codon:yes stop_codon:yes gene_type:complete